MCLSIDQNRSVQCVRSRSPCGCWDPVHRTRRPLLPGEEGDVTSLVWRLSVAPTSSEVGPNSTFWGWWQASLSGRPGDVGASLALSLAEL